MARTKDTRHYTTDRGPPVLEGERAPVHTSEQIGPKRFRMESGFLLCKDVPIARTGWLQYRPGEVPVPPSPDSPVLWVRREPEELFCPETMGSFVGAAVTNDHPPVNVDNQNWRTLAGGYCLEVRRGTGDDAEMLLADLVISDAHLIDEVERGLREVSIGYDARYITLGPGEGQQVEIIGNHIALVKKGRCGPRCAIGDRQPETKKDPIMGTKTRVPLSVRERLEELLQDDDQGATGAEAEGLHVHIHTQDAAPRAQDEPPQPQGDPALVARVTALETTINGMSETLATIAKAVTTKDAAPQPGAQQQGQQQIEDPNAGANGGDSAALATSYQELVSQAEILVPGIRVPTMDSAAPRARTIDGMCQIRRRTLSAVSMTNDGAALLTQVAGADLDIDKASCVEIATVFRAAAVAKGLQNNRQSTGDANRAPDNGGDKPIHKTPSLAEINAANAAYWAGQAKLV